MPLEPQLEFRPDAEASYEVATKALMVVKQSGVTQFGFVAPEKYMSSQSSDRN